MKKLLIIAAITFAVVGCGKSSDSSKSGDSTKSSRTMEQNRLNSANQLEGLE